MTEQELIALAATSENPNAVLIQLFKELKRKVDKLEDEMGEGMEMKHDKMIEEIAMKLAIRLIDVQKGEDGHTPTEDELLELITPLIPQVQDGKTPTNDELLALIRPLIPQIKDGATPTRDELIALITPLIPAPIKGADGSPDSPAQVRDKLEALVGDERLDVSAVKGIDEKLKAVSERPVNTIFGPGKTKLITLNLSAQLNGVTKTFYVGTHFGITGVWGSSAPFIFQPIVDYTESGKSITFTAAVDAAVSLAAGQSLVIQYLR